MDSKNVLDFIRLHGFVLLSARGPVPNLAQWIAAEPIRGSWWAHPKAHDIFEASQAVCESPEVLVCKFIGGKVTYIHRRYWAPLVRLHSRFAAEQLARVHEVHTASGKHVVEQIPFPKWVPADVKAAAAELSVADAEDQLSEILNIVRKKKTARRKQ